MVTAEDKSLNPILTVILPSLNVYLYIDKCINSLISQSVFSELEVLLIDAGSTDGTLERLYAYENEYSNMHVIISEKKSYGYQVNLGISMAKGSYIAILETDDFVMDNMYETLYKIAKDNNLDYVKSDFYRFSTMLNGYELLKPDNTFLHNEKIYDQVIDPTFIDDVYKSDYLIWRGIYKTSFLKENGIRLRETPGAAFQDIGFVEKVISCADRAMYIKDMLYCYRTDRPTASMNSGKAIIFSKDEFENLFDEWKDRLPHVKGVYLYMFQSFVGNIIFLLKGKRIFDEDVYPSYKWLKDKIDEAVSKGVITKDDVFPWVREGYERICNNAEGLADELAQLERPRMELVEACKELGNKKTIIFGAGNYGRECLIYLDSNGIKVDCFIDNKAETICEFAGKPVVKPEDVSDIADTTFVVANKNHYEMMKKQLNQMDVQDEDILIWR